jgi:hypothetical protein
MLTAVLALRTAPSVGGVLVAVVVVGGAVALAFWPVQGRTGEQWLPLVARWSWARYTGSSRALGPGPRAGHVTTVDLDGREATPLAAADGRRSGGRSGPFDRLEVIAVPFEPETGDRDASAPGTAAPEMGMVVDRRARSGTAVLAVRGHSFALLGPAEQDARIAAWARVLAALAREGSGVHRVQWVESCLPDDGAAVRRYWADGAVLGAETDAGRSYRSLMDESAPITRRHRVLVALTVRSPRTSRPRTSRARFSWSPRVTAGVEMGIAGRLSREVLALERALDTADITVDGVLGPGPLRRILGESFASTGPGDGSNDAPPSDPGASWSWPMAVETHWDAVRTDATWHATYWIAEWPRVEVTPDFLGPLLFSPLRRTIAVTMEPVSPSRAARQVAQARTADIADGELRRRGGFLTTARHSREAQGVEERDVELADGHAQFRFTGYVTVTADTRHSLADACASLEQSAGHARVELRRLFGEQDVAFTCSLPLGRGLA